MRWATTHRSRSNSWVRKRAQYWTVTMEAVPEPLVAPVTLDDPRELLTGYLGFYRAVIVRKLDGMPEKELRGTRLPSGWTPLSLLRHLTYVERRWLRWGFMAEQVNKPWGPNGPGSDWIVAP